MPPSESDSAKAAPVFEKSQRNFLRVIFDILISSSKKNHVPKIIGESKIRINDREAEKLAKKADLRIKSCLGQLRMEGQGPFLCRD